ncbi:MAG: N-acetylglucosamine-6-phosphate deacetylase, partial [Verrucomicrobiota bacterium]
PRFATTRFLADQGITVAAGHCNPDLDQLKGAIDSGLHMCTHLGNGCPMELHRHDNIIQRALSLSDQLWLCFIPDGVHVPFLTLTNYLKAANLNRVIMVSDAISAASLGPGLYSLGDWDIKIGDDLVARSPDESHFIGSTVTWPRILKNLEGPLGFSENEIEQTTILNPRAALAASANDV